jgi:hypothetical protein
MRRRIHVKSYEEEDTRALTVATTLLGARVVDENRILHR